MIGYLATAVIAYIIGILFTKSNATKEELDAKYWDGYEKGYKRAYKEGVEKATLVYTNMEKQLLGFQSRMETRDYERGIYSVSLIYRPEYKKVD